MDDRDLPTPALDLAVSNKAADGASDRCVDGPCTTARRVHAFKQVYDDGIYRLGGDVSRHNGEFHWAFLYEYEQEGLGRNSPVGALTVLRRRHCRRVPAPALFRYLMLM